MKTITLKINVEDLPQLGAFLSATSHLNLSTQNRYSQYKKQIKEELSNLYDKELIEADAKIKSQQEVIKSDEKLLEAKLKLKKLFGFNGIVKDTAIPKELLDFIISLDVKQTKGNVTHIHTASYIAFNEKLYIEVISNETENTSEIFIVNETEKVLHTNLITAIGEYAKLHRSKFIVSTNGMSNALTTGISTSFLCGAITAANTITNSISSK